MKANAHVARLLGCAAAMLAMHAAAQSAASYPAKPIRLIIPFAKGGAADYVARVIEPRWSQIAGQDVVIDNRPGAYGNAGLEAAARSAADGYTLLLGNLDAMAINPSLYRSKSVVPLRDFAPVTQIVDVPSALVAHPSFPPGSAKELIAYVKARPGKFAFASPGPASTNRLEMELFMQSSGTSLSHRPYKDGLGPALMGLIAGEAAVMFMPLPTVAGEVRGGKLKLLGVAARGRVEAFPKAATLAEQGVAQMAGGTWQGVFAPKATPPQVVDKLHAIVLQVMASPRVKFHLNGAGIEAITSESPQQFAGLLRADTERWTRVVRESRAAPQ
jgi:tripartite-type tricarboxylate transporter receptor subunit TctC